MTDTVELSACPFCGEPPKLTEVAGGATIYCRSMNCFGPGTPMYGSVADAAQAWNKRASPTYEEPVAERVRSTLAPLFDALQSAQGIAEESGNVDAQALVSSIGEAFNRVRSVLASNPPEPTEADKPTHRHVKRGTEYRVVSRGARLQVEPGTTLKDDDRMVIYQDVHDGSWSVRLPAEFDDGRFVALSPTAGERG